MSEKAAFPLFRTPVEVGKPLRAIGLYDRNVFVGSCFAEHIGRQFATNRLRALVNPLGVMYNPLSIARLFRTEQSDSSRAYIYNKGMWHTWLGDSSLSRLTFEECQSATDEALRQLHEALFQADNLFLTLGTSRCYVYRPTYEHVANCHQMPGADFVEVELKVEEIVDELRAVLEQLHRQNPRLQVVFTVSPFRYQKYGMHESQLSKARLLLGIETLCAAFPEWVSYFPAYEIVMDELRDYRYYADDMLHPSDAAVRYIWQRLSEAWMADDTRRWLERWQPVRQALEHRPLHPESPAYEAFRQQTQKLLECLRHDYPLIEIKNEELRMKN